MPFAKLNEVELYYEEAGDGYPILLGHGGFSDVTEWDPQVGALSQSYRTIRYDRRGCGRSQPRDVPQMADLWVEDMKQLMDSLGLEQAYLGGVSYGGMLLIEFLRKYPSMCRAAVIVSATAPGTRRQPGRGRSTSRIGWGVSQPSPRQPWWCKPPTITPFPLSTGEENANAMPNAELVTLEGGHTINNELPEEFNRAMLEFLARV